MNTPLDFLRAWLPIGQRENGGDNAEELRLWLDSMAAAPAEEIAASLAQRLTAMIAVQENLHMRTRLLDTFDDIAQELLPRLEKEIQRTPLPFTARAQHRAIAADNLLKGLASGYTNVVVSIEMRKLASGLGQMAQHALQRAIASLRRRQLLAYRAYAAPSPASWQQLHELFRTAMRLDLLGPPKSGPTVGQLYVSTLLIAYADPGKFDRSELDLLHDCAVRASALVHLRAAEQVRELRPDTPLFVIQPGDNGPGKPLVRTPQNAQSGRLFLDCTELAATLRSDIGARARVDVPHEWLLPQAPLPMLRMLAAMWGAQPTRRYSRMRFRPRADLVAGLLDVTLFLTGAAYRRRRDDPSRRHHPTAPAISEWVLVDESPDGFGVRYVRGDIGAVAVGDIVAIRPRESSRVQICLVRRVSNAGQTRFEIGLQNLSPSGVVVELPASTGGLRGKAILLPRMPAFGNAAGLIAPPESVPPTLELRYPTGGRELVLRLAQRLESGSACEFHLLRADDDAPDAASTGGNG